MTSSRSTRTTGTTRSPLGRRGVLRLASLAVLATTAVARSREEGSVRTAPPRPGTPAGPGGPDTLGDVRLVSAEVEREEGDASAIPAVVAAMHASGAAIYGSLAGATEGNLAVSPSSIFTALALTANGARGETLDQLGLVLGGAGTATVNGGLNALTAHLDSLAGTARKSDGHPARIALDQANALFGQEGLTWGEPFLDALARSYGAGMNVVDWAGDTEAARAAVNAWTAKQTGDRIEEILPADAVDTDVRLVLVNALHLKAPWDKPFDKGLTRDGAFTLLDDGTVDVSLMSGATPNGDAHAEGEGWTAARLPYAGGTVAMTVVLPDAGRFADVERDLATRGAGPYLEALRPEEVEVTLPSWTFSVHTSLVEPIRALGVELPFEPAADFSGMTTDDRLYVGAIEHEVFVAVDEEGTEAAAATAVVVIRVSAAPAYPSLVADRPFLFVVHDVEHGTPLFLGRVVDPRS